MWSGAGTSFSHWELLVPASPSLFNLAICLPTALCRFSLGDEVFPKLLENVSCTANFTSYFEVAKSHLPLAEKLALGEKGPPP